MFVSNILVLGVCALVSWLLVPYVCAGLGMTILAASFLFNGLLFSFAICILLYFSRTKEIGIVVMGIASMVGSACIASESRHIGENARGREGFIIEHNDYIYKSNGSLLWNINYRDRVFKAISPNGPVLVSIGYRTKYKEGSYSDPDKIIVWADEYDYDGNELSTFEKTFDYDEDFELDAEKIKYIKMRLRVDKNIFLRHQIN